MTPEKLNQLLSQGEGLTVEYKKFTDELSNSVFETVRYFSHRYGSYILTAASTPITSRHIRRTRYWHTSLSTSGARSDREIGGQRQTLHA